MRKLQTNVPSRAAGADGSQLIGEAHHTSVVTAASFIPEAAITGADTNTRKISLVNRGQNGSGNVEVAALTFSNGVNAPAGVKKQLTLSATVANRAVKKGDILQFVSLHLGTGITDPGGIAQYEIR